MELRKLLKDCIKNDRAAQKQVFDHFAMQMFLVCRRYLSTDETAEEAMMNGFLKFFQSLEKFEYINDASTAGWLKKIMVNECLMNLRAGNSFLQMPLDKGADEAYDENIIAAMSAEEIFRLITKLPVGYRTVFNLYVVESMTHKEIASALGISEGTSKSQLNKARNLLQQYLIHSDSEYASRKTK